jgi:hypothetical protein
MDQETAAEIRKLHAEIMALEDKLDFLFRHFNVDYIRDMSGVDPRLVAAIQKGDMISAIRIYREITNVGLAEAKAAVEGLWAKYSG